MIRASMPNLARKGPNRVWSDYKTMRVPIEIFDDVKQYMERKKQVYLAEQQGVDLADTLIESGGPFTSEGSDLKGMIRNVIREEMQQLRGGANTVEIPPAKMSAKERVKELLMARPEEKLTTIQIEKMLDIPGPTARQSTRELSEEESKIIKIAGRPNKYYFDPNL